MWKFLRLGFVVAGLTVLGAAQVHADPDTSDTRLLTQPAISAKNIAFIYSEDLWVADQDGKNPRRLTTDIGVESNPVFSPDGQTIAFSAQYDGNTDVYTIPVTGGTATRLTWHPGPDIVRGFTPDGKVLFASNRNVYSNRHMQLFTVDRLASVSDLVADTAGALIGALAADVFFFSRVVDWPPARR